VNKKQDCLLFYVTAPITNNAIYSSSLNMCMVDMVLSAAQSLGTSLCMKHCFTFSKNTSTNTFHSTFSKDLRSISDTNIKLHGQI